MSNTMREILFRGKREVDNVWVYGVLYDNYIIREIDWRYEYPKAILYAIRHETVGQFTGLTDKNGNKIFEGDIVKIKGKIRYIFYGISSFRHTNYGEYAEELKDVNTDRDCEIISNIHDSPELLEENK